MNPPDPLTHEPGCFLEESVLQDELGEVPPPRLESKQESSPFKYIYGGGGGSAKKHDLYVW